MARKTAQDKVAKLLVETVPIDSLQPHPDNPRKGNVKVIAESLETNGQFQPIVVQKSTNFIIAGNHTWKAAKSLGWPTIDIVKYDVDDEGAKRVLLAANRTADLATYDTEVLALVLKSLDTPVGTGYDPDTMATIIDAVASQDTGALNDAIQPVRIQVVEHDEPDTADEFDAKRVVEGPGEAVDGFADDMLDDDLAGDSNVGAFVLDPEPDLRGDNYYGIPVLNKNMLTDKVPEPFDTWAGKEATPDDGVTTWLWNYGMGGVSGLPIKEGRAWLSFFAYDEKFESWWYEPHVYTGRAINHGFKNAVVPDFSMYDEMPRCLHIWNHYRRMWIARYLQEAGIRVAPFFQFADMGSFDFCLVGLPVNAPVLFFNGQNVRTNERDAGGRSKSERLHAEAWSRALSELTPQSLVVYTGPPGRNIIEDMVQPAIPTTFIDNYVAKRRDLVFGHKEDEVRFDDAAGAKAPPKARKKTVS